MPWPLPWAWSPWALWAPSPEPPAPYKGGILWHRDEDARDGIKDGVHSGKYGASLPGAVRGARTTSGFHHIALVCKDMKETIRWYEGAMGFRLRGFTCSS